MTRLVAYAGGGGEPSERGGSAVAAAGSEADRRHRPAVHGPCAYGTMQGGRGQQRRTPARGRRVSRPGADGDCLWSHGPGGVKGAGLGERMTPKHVFGGFLREWREGWAHRSVAATAIRLSSIAARPVPKHRVRAWEQGQAPQSDWELRALVRLLRQDGLRDTEVVEAIESAFAARLSVSYPSQFTHDNLAMSRDVEGFAEAAFRLEAPLELPGHLALLRALRPAVGADGDGAGRRLRRSRARAYVLLRCRLAQRCEWTGRFTAMASLCADNERLCREVLGAGACDQSRQHQQLMAAYGRGRAGDRSAAADVWRLHEAFASSGSASETAAAYLWALDLFDGLTPAQARAARERERGVLDRCERLEGDGRRVEPRLHLLDLACRQSRWGDAAAQLEALSRRPSCAGGLHRILVLLATGDLAVHTRRPDEAERAYSVALREARDCGHLPQYERALAGLRALGLSPIELPPLAAEARLLGARY